MAVSVKTSDVITGSACECEWDRGEESTCAHCVNAAGAAHAAHEAKVAEEKARRGHVLATEAFYRS